ncbi:GNAT family N-acetyltransferase [Nocardia fluminea]
MDLALDSSGAIVGVAAWLATFHILPRPTLGRQLKSIHTYGSLAGRANAGARATYAAGVQEQHWHLLAVGVSAAARGRGHGRDLIAAGMYRAAADGVPVHLETTNPGNLSFYERLGFDTTAVLDLPDGGPRRWLMRQVPQPILNPGRDRRPRNT